MALMKEKWVLGCIRIWARECAGTPNSYTTSIANLDIFMIVQVSTASNEDGLIMEASKLLNSKNEAL